MRRGRSAISQALFADLVCTGALVPDLELLGDDNFEGLLSDRQHAAALDVETELFRFGVTDLAKAPRDCSLRMADRF